MPFFGPTDDEYGEFVAAGLMQMRVELGDDRVDELLAEATDDYGDPEEGDEAIDFPVDLQEVADWALSGTDPDIERVDRFFRVYRACPAYSHFYVLVVHYWSDLNESAKDRFWIHMQDVLDDARDEVVEPALYALWCEWFENPAVSGETWTRLVEEAPDQRLERLLPYSGPVPVEVKAPLWERLVTDQRWHRALLTSLASSIDDMCGSTDIVLGRALLARLELPPDTEHLAEARNRYAEMPDSFRNRAVYLVDSGAIEFQQEEHDG